MTSGRIGWRSLLGTLSLAAACGSGTANQQATPSLMTGCPEQPTRPVAPGGYYVNSNTVCTASGRPHLFHGVDRPTLEWSSAGQYLSLSDFRRMGSWNANVVRISLNQDFWIAESPLHDPSYSARIDGAIAWAEMAGLDVILDLHWSDKGVLGSCLPSFGGCQQRMADVNSLTFWSEVAARYQNDGRVLFELYNEPHNVSWPVWRSGGDTGDGFVAVGMQQLYGAVRSTGAQNLVIIGGIDWGYDLSGVPANRIDGYNILYSTHPYAGAPDKLPMRWDQYWGFLTSSDPVIVTEFGDTSGTCSSDFSAELVDYADAHTAGWTAWAWFPGGCTFSGLIDDWTGTPSPSGAIVKEALLRYHDPPASLAADGGAAYIPKGCIASNTAVAPAGELIAGLGGRVFTFPKGSAAAPTYTTMGGALHITENTPATSMSQYVGVLIGGGDSCTDASAFAGVQFAISGSFSGCTMNYATGDVAHAYSDGTSMTAPIGTGPMGAYAPYATIAPDQVTSTPRTLRVPFVDGPSGGYPATPIDKAKLTAVLWYFAIDPTSATDVGTTTCVADVTIDDVRFY